MWKNLNYGNMARVSARDRIKLTVCPSPPHNITLQIIYMYVHALQLDVGAMIWILSGEANVHAAWSAT